MTIQEMLSPMGILSYSDLARKTGLSRQRAHQIWYGRTQIGRRVAGRIATALGIPPGMVMGAELPARRIRLTRKQR